MTPVRNNGGRSNVRETRWDIRQYVGWGVTIIAVGAVVLCVFFCMYQFAAIRAGIGRLIEILTPVIYGIVIAYLLYPIYRRLLYGLKSLLECRLKWTGGRAQLTAEIAAMVLTFALLFCIVAGLLALVLPRLAASILTIVTTFPATMNTMSQSMQGLVHTLFRSNPEMEENAMRLYVQAMLYAENWIQTDLLTQIQGMLSYFTDIVLNTVLFVKNILIGIVVAVYLIANKQKFISQGKKLLYSVVGLRVGNVIVENAHFANRAFGGYLGGQIVDSSMVGLITGIVMSIMGMPYPLLLAVIIGTTNIIPFFGPFIGAVPCAILVFMVNPMQALYFLIFILIMQQVDGNIICPRIVGQTTGVSSFWVLFSILLFSGLFGFVGMVIGVPLFAVTEHIVSELVNRSLCRKNLPRNAADYIALARIDEETRRPVRQTEPEGTARRRTEKPNRHRRSRQNRKRR